MSLPDFPCVRAFLRYYLTNLIEEVRPQGKVGYGCVFGYSCHIGMIGKQDSGRDVMLSPRRCAQLGLSAASLTLVTSITVLVAGAAESSRINNRPVVDIASHVTPLASGQIQSIQSDTPQATASSK